MSRENNVSFKKKKKRTSGNGGSNAPKWFQAYEEREQQRWARQEECNKKQLEFNEWVKNEFAKHEKFIKAVIKINCLKDPDKE